MRSYKNAAQNSKFLNNNHDKSFRSIYNSLPKNTQSPKAQFIQEIAELCKVSEITVRMYISGVYRPDALKRSLIAKKLNANPDTLFPENPNEL